MQNYGEKGKAKNVLFLISITALLLLLPLMGIMAAGRPVGQYLEFPPLTTYVRHADFSWTVFILLALLVAAVTAPFLIRLSCSTGKTGPVGSFFTFKFPAWGWIASGSCAAFWILAWNRFEWFSCLQPYTFSPLWISFIIAINAATFARSGRCMMKDRTLYFLLLFPLSALFWWFFEYLNRFVQNWHYVGAEIFSPSEYAVFATLSFSTVLPAVLGVCEFLETMPGAGARMDDFAKISFPNVKVASAFILLAACSGLALIGIFPDFLFPLLWLSPLLIIASLQALMGRENIFSGIASGRWRRIFLLALSALMCGFLWEMWNFYSLPKWGYSVPFVNRFHIFEMPLLGYAGYLPFGIECAVIAGLLKDFLIYEKEDI